NSTGTGQLSITDGGTVRVLAGDTPGQVFVGKGLGTGIVTIDTGGELYVEGDLHVSSNNDVSGNSSQTGLMRIIGTGSATVTGTTYVGNGTSPDLNGVLAG